MNSISTGDIKGNTGDNLIGKNITKVSQIMTPESINESHNILEKQRLTAYIWKSIGKIIIIILKKGPEITKTINVIRDIIQEIDGYYTERKLVSISISPESFTFSF